MPALTLNNKTYWVDPKDAEVEGNWTDNGIGAYEFWGAKGNDSKIEFEIENVTIHLATDEDDLEVTDPATLQELEGIALTDPDGEWSKLAPNYEAEDPEPQERDYEEDHA
jgi:hypothetical protein